ncbi:MAG: hypothetical protein ABIT76_03505 [Chthoniobacterales bacterium]
MRTTHFAPRALLLAIVIATFCGHSALQAEDRNGLLFNVAKKTLSREDGPNMDYAKEIARDLVLKATLKNISMKDREPGSVEYSILIRRWGGEIGSTQRYSGTVPLTALKRGQEVEVNSGQFHIGGHLHGTSRIHVDELEAWKFIVIIGDQKTEFRSSAKFDVLDKKATPAPAK